MPEETNTKETLDVAAIAKQAAEEAVKAFKQSLEDEPPKKKAGLITQHDNAGDLPFKGLGDFLMAVKDAGRGRPDPRLHKLYSTDGYSLNGALGDDFVGGLVKSAYKSRYMKQTGLNEGNNALGGFLVGTDRNNSIIQRMYDVGSLLQRVDMVGVSAGSNGMTFNAVNETSRADGSRMGGIRGYWTAEGGTKQASYPEFREMELRLHKVAALVYATDELLQDANALESWIMSNLPEELVFVVEDAIINGTGVGMPLGLLGSITPAGCVISVAKEVGQAADTIVSQNIVKMWARLYNASRRSAVWLVNQDLLPQLYQLSMAVGTGGLPVFQPPGGLSASPYATLMGRPQLVVGRFGNGLSLSGHDEWVELYRHPSLDVTGTGLTLETWIYPRRWNGTGPILTKGDHQFGLVQVGQGEIEFFIHDGQRIAVRAPTPSGWRYRWHHLAGTYDGSALRIYGDGKVLATRSHSGTIDHFPFPVNVGRNAELHGQGPLQRRAVEAGQVGRVGDLYRRPDSVHQSGTVQDLLGQRQVGGVVAAQEREPLAGVAERDAGEQVQVVVHDRGGDLLAGQVDEARARHPEQHQHAEQPLLVVVHAGDLRQLVRVHREARVHHHGLRHLLVRGDPPVQRRQPLLYPGEAPQLLGRPRRYLP